MERIKHVSLKLLAAFLAFMLVLSLASLIILNSGVLDHFAKNLAVSLFNEKLFGRLEVQELHLKFPNNVTLVNPRIYGPGEKAPALQARTLALKFNFLTLLQPDIKKLYVRQMTADSLSARVIEQKNGKLNLETIFTSRDPDTTKAPLEHFFCKTLQVKNSTLSYSGKIYRSESVSFEVKNINLDLSKFTVQKKLLKGTLDHLTFNIPRNRFLLKEATGKFFFSETRSEVLALKVASSKSHAEFSSTVDHFNIFSQQLAQQLALSSSFLNIQELAIHSDDLKLLYPAVVIPSGMYSLKGNARGKKDDIQIIDALLTHLNNKVAAKGELLNLLNSNAFAYDLKCDSSKITVPFVESFMTEPSQKEIARKVGDITFIGRAKGNLNTVNAEMTTFSRAGEASLNTVASKEKSDQLSFKGTFALKGLKPHIFMTQAAGKSLVNASGNFEGKADKMELLQLTMNLKVADSFWHNQPVKEGTISLSYGNRLLNSSVALKNNLASFAFDAGIDWKDKTPHYRVSGKTERVDLSKIVDSKAFTTDLSGIFAIQGSGFDPGMLNLSGMIQFAPSTINGFELKDRSKATLEIVQNGASSRTSINTDFVDILAEGDYSFAELINLGRFAGSGISREITEQNIWKSASSATLITGSNLKKPFSVHYRISVKEITPFAPFLPFQNIALQGRAEGDAIYRNGQCAISSSINLASLHFHNHLLLENLFMEAGMNCNGSGVSKASATGKASSIAVGDKKAGHAIFSGTYIPSQLEASLDLAIPDPDQSVSVKFAATKIDSGYALLFNQLSIKDNSGTWQAAENSRLMLGRTSARFNRFTISKGAQRAMLDGELSNSQPGSFQCTLSNFELNELKRFALDPSLDKLSGTINASLTISGNPDSKTSLLSINGKEIRYDKFTVGILQGNAVHHNNQLRFDMHSNLPIPEKTPEPALPSLNTIDGSGTIPLVLNYYPLQWHIAEQQSINASFRSDNLSAQFLEYLLPFFTSAEGVMPTTLKIEGRTPQPDIYLTTHLRQTKIKIEPTQVSYQLDGDVYATQKAIELRNVTISDNVHGNGTIEGLVMLEKLEPKELDLAGQFNHLLLFNKKDMQDETSFGSITGTTTNILVHGNISEPVVEGELRIDAADFSLYRSGANESAKYVGVDKFIEFVPRYPTANLPGLKKNREITKPTEFYHSLIDILQIKNLRFSSVEPLMYTVIFERIRGEQLETSVNNLSLIVNKKNQQYRLFGSVNVIGGKYRFSNSNFDLENGGKIFWNNVDIRNGVMDNLYGSKYVNASSQQTGDRDNVKLLLAMTGTLNDPQVIMGYYLNEQTQPYASVNMIGGHTSQIDPNAELNVISMLLSKQWYIKPGSSGQSGNIAVASVGFSTGTGILSSRISRLIQDIGGLESFNVNLGMDKRGALSGLDLYFALSVPGTDGKVRFIGTGSSPDIGKTAIANYYGTAQKIEYRITPKVYLEASRSFGLTGSTTSISNLQKPAETWGVSLSYKERFQSWDKFWKSLIPSSDKKR
ncbi:MAG: translocation/assembly module TamB [Chlorobium sp.]|nr:MAG: translocation/assembly module TamB [Chlorobium sp.]